MMIKTVVQRGQKVSFKGSLWTGWSRGGVELRKGTETTLMGGGGGGGHVNRCLLYRGREGSSMPPTN
jgi:hypothetical protein